MTPVYVSKLAIWLTAGVLAGLGVAVHLFVAHARVAKGLAIISIRQMQIRTVRLLKDLHQHQRGTSPTGQPGDGWDLFQHTIEQALRVPAGSIYTPLEPLPDTQTQVPHDKA